MDKKLITDAIQNLQIGNIVLHDCNLTRFKPLPEFREFEFGQQFKLSVQHEKFKATVIGKSPYIFRVLVGLGVRVVNVQDSQPEPLYQIEASFEVDYTMTNDVTDEALHEFAQFNSVHNVWPFWRQFVYSMANQSHLPCPEVPLNASLQSLEDAASQQSM